MCGNDELNNKTTLIHVQADGDNDTLHYIWDLTRQPTILVALCEKNTNVTIEWTKTLRDADSVKFSTKPKYSMAFVLTKVSSRTTSMKLLHVTCHDTISSTYFDNLFLSFRLFAFRFSCTMIPIMKHR